VNPHDLLTSDHQALRVQAGKLRDLIGQNPQAMAASLTEFQKEVQKHFKREEAYYRVLDDGKRVEDRGLIHQLRNDHAAVVFTLESLAIRLRKDGINPDWHTRFDNLMNVFLPHLDQEEKHLFPAGRKMLTPQELDIISQHIQSCE
jgi:hemerythrin